MSAVLVIAAHPDDAEFAFGGTIARLAGGGTTVSYAVVTDGAQGSDDARRPDSEIAEIRRAEQRAAAKLLGVSDVSFLGFTDGSVSDSRALRMALTREIRRVRPEVVLTHQPLRSLQFPVGASHPDHLAVGEAALNAVYPFARNPRAFPELLADGLSVHRVAEVWMPGYEHTDFLVNVDDTAEQKMMAILAHRSQFSGSSDPRSDIQWVVDRMTTYGAELGCRFAEGLKRIVITGGARSPLLLQPRAGELASQLARSSDSLERGERETPIPE